MWGIPRCKHWRGQCRISMVWSEVTCKRCWRSRKQRDHRARTHLPLEPRQVLEAKELYARGRGLHHIGKLLGCHPVAVWQALRRDLKNVGGRATNTISIVLEKSERELRGMKVPMTPLERIIGALQLALEAGEEELMRATTRAFRRRGVEPWTYPDWWDERLKESLSQP